MTDERRQYQRLNLTRPVDGWFGDFAIRLVDVSASGALIECDDVIPADARALLRFFWRNEEVEILARTARSEEHRSGLKFLEENESLRRLIAESATELLKAQEANAQGQREQNFIADETLTAASARVRLSGFVTWILGDSGWRKRASLLPDQPPDGFTVSAAEDDGQVELLRRTYESGDAEARKLTRIFAELSVANAS